MRRLCLGYTGGFRRRDVMAESRGDGTRWYRQLSVGNCFSYSAEDMKQNYTESRRSLQSPNQLITHTCSEGHLRRHPVYYLPRSPEETSAGDLKASGLLQSGPNSVHIQYTTSMEPFKIKLECGPMPNLMVTLPNIGGAICSTPQSLADAYY